MITPINARTGKTYRKRTREALEAWQKDTGKAGQLWTTYAGWKELGCKVRKGSSNVYIKPVKGRGYILYHQSQLVRDPKLDILHEAWSWYTDPAKISQRKAREASDREFNREYRKGRQLRAVHTETVEPERFDETFNLWEVAG